MTNAVCFLTQHQVDPGLTPEALSEQLSKDWPELGEFVVADLADDAEAADSNGIHTFSLDRGEESILVTVMPSPFAPDTSELCQSSLLWPDAAEFNDDYGATCIVTAFAPDYDDIAKRKLLTQAVASIIAISPQTFSVFWGDAEHLILPELFREMALKMLPEIPLYIWVAFHTGYLPDNKFAATTVGLDSLGLMDVEIPDSPKAPEETRDFIMNIAMYLLENGLVIKDGDTVGETETEKIRAVYTRSMVDEEKMVIQLVGEQAGS